MNTFLQAARAESAKVFTTRMWWILAVVMMGYVGLTAGGLGASLGWSLDQGDGGSGMPPGVNLPAMIYGFATSVGYVFPVLFGALSVTGEYRHQTVTPTFLATPRRGLALGAKFAVQLLLGALYGVLAFAATIGLGALALAIFGQDTGLGDVDTWFSVLRGIVAMALWAAIGVGLGALVRNQVAAIVIVIAFTQFLEPVLRMVTLFVEALAPVGKFLPGAASDALVGTSFFSFAGMDGAMGMQTLTSWQGGLVLLAYAALAAFGGYFTSWRKDVT